MVLAKITAPVLETESEEKVRRALKNLFPTVKFERKGLFLEGSGSSADLEVLKEKIWNQYILDTVRDALLKNYDPAERKTFILLNKQAAFSGKVALVDDPNEEILGSIRIELSGKDLLKFIDKFAPPTRDGKPIL